ncbi:MULTISPECIES: pilus assembly protein [Marinobacter]|jgi:type IV pilus assembly protein PilY1|uniref:Type IV fimbrial biogenesis protein PilY1 n=1 Tax=Marinobacter excellens LAMA 842 TaxID=1306954 RepID=A0A137SAC2_9GAMM|nr:MULTISPECIES: PilC/PilY family type IV pilus protein [Marinobacter]KXO09374.1 Type IV fimbrial biogenesis protein PilY1 [Marinobacter excellens LAMA 842]MCD1631702.1 pilus assembly protein PilY [Marinobacter shengliensis]
MKINTRLLTFGLSFGLSLGTGVASADDTEIFFNTTASEIRPNILFILDNSGSMAANVTTTSTYDPSETYSGNAPDGSIWLLSGNTLYAYPAEANKCADITQRFATTGRVLGYRMASWRRSGWRGSEAWRNPSTSYMASGNFLECQNDRGVHGETDSSNAKYARNHTNKWGNEGQEIDWSQIEHNTFWSANYVNWYFNHRETTTRTRLEIVQEVAKNLADSLSGVNIGLMAFNPDGNARQGGRLLVPVENIETNRDAFKDAVEDLGADTWTPLSETLFGAMRYFGGQAPFLDTSPVSGTVQDGNYISPVEYECQSNNIILLTDGEPTYDGDPTSGNYHSTEDKNSRDAMEGVVGSCTGNCLDEIAEYMFSNDVYSGLSEEINVNTYTVGFTTNQQLLSDTAAKGGGEYYLADDTESLENAFESFVRSVLAVNTTFVAPGVAVNTFNRLNHLDSLYFSVFQPDVAPRWNGNLKRYRLGSDGKIYDVNDNEATDSSTGFFRNSAQSWWSPVADGPNVALGGAASKQPDNNASRKVYTYYSGSSTKDLTASVNAVSVANKANLTKAMFGDATMADSEHEKLINWTRGLDVNDENRNGLTTDARKFIADPLHSVPHLVIYGGDATSPDTTVFFGDNQGYIHAVDGETGESYFSFIPSELLGNQSVLMENDKTITQRVYGMDGSIVSWQNDSNNDGTINATDGDHLYIYSGMRRGGRNYYALDATTRNQPRMLWSIQGGTGSYTELGETWSKPVKTKVKIHNSIKDVLIFAGGYDSQQDTVLTRTEDTVGRALYIVDAETGARLWWAGPVGSGADLELADMKYSMPAAPKAIDVTGDGWTNQVYVGDMGGQVWRFDIFNGLRTENLVTGGVVADFGGGAAADNRRFYHSPDLFGFKMGASRYLGLVIGSGWQAHPLDTAIEDRIYMLRMADVTEPPYDADGNVDYSLIKVSESDLFDTTDNLIEEGNEAQRTQAQSDLAAASGWYIRLTRSGEKVLSSSQTVSGQLFITTYEPTASTNACLPAAGKARLYHVYVADGTPVVNYDLIVSADPDELTKEDREVELMTVGLPPDPQRMRVDGLDIICVGAECRPIDTVTGVLETYWYEE